MRARIFLCLVLVSLSVACYSIFPEPKSYYEQFRNPNLAYVWDFNESLEAGGHTYNSTYFQLRKYHWYDGVLEIPYEFNYKHEEGHIYTEQLLGIDNIDRFESTQFTLQNLTDETDFRQSYFISVSEGIADYYALNYFHNKIGGDYLSFTQKHTNSNLSLNTQANQHYHGLVYIVHSLKTGEYANFASLIANFGSKQQYDQYSAYMAELKIIGYPKLSISDV